MNTLNQVLESALTLPDEQQEMLITILKRRHAESRRDQIAVDAQQSLTDFREGKFEAQSANDAIAELKCSLDDLV